MKFNGKVTVKNVEWLAEDVFRLTFNKPSEMGDIQPGQFFNFTASRTGFPMLRRAISVSGYGNNYFEVTVKILGAGTQELSFLKVHDEVEVMGPLGNGFDCHKEGKVLIVGGGIGVAPLKALLEMGFSQSVKVDVLLGFRDRPFMEKDFMKLADRVQIVSENDSNYERGYVTEPFKRMIEETKYSMIYSCGPHVMLESIAKIANEKGLKVQLLMEEKMACGIGACLVCTCKIKEGEFGYKHSRMCKEGPMFYASEVIFDAE